MPQDRDLIYLGGCDVEWVGAKQNSNDTYLDATATVVFSVYASDLDTDNENGTVVTGASALTMTYISDSDGKFIGHLPATASLVRDTYYWMETTATPSGGTPHTRRGLVQAVDHEFGP